MNFIRSFIAAYLNLRFAIAVMYASDYVGNPYYDGVDGWSNLMLNDSSLLTGELGDGAEFLLYTRNANEVPEPYSIFSDEDRFFSTFSPQSKTKIIIHGWRARAPGHFTELLRKAYHAIGDYNLIMVDWSNAGALHPYYPYAKSNVPSVGLQVATFIDKLCLNYKVKPEDIHLIGHSLGAHVAGVAGRLITTGVIGRITGLDPAGPLYSIKKLNNRLSVYSAKFVDVIHTCGYYLGMKYPIGHVNFYPNLGIPSQPGCGFDYSGVCSHQRAYGYFAESVVTPNGFLATSCPSALSFKRNVCAGRSKIPMGEATPSSARGSYYLTTNNKIPFAKKH